MSDSEWRGRVAETALCVALLAAVALSLWLLKENILTYRPY